MKDHISYSQIRTYVKCPYLWKLINDGVVKLNTQAISRGKFAHEVLAELGQQAINGKQITDKLIDEIGIEKMSSLDGVVLNYDNYSTILDQIKTLVASGIIEFSNTISVESDFSFFIDNIKVVGRIDRIDETIAGVEIIDYKTSVAKTDSDMAELELSIYGLALKELQQFKNKPIIGKLLYIPTGYETVFDLDIQSKYAVNYIKAVADKMLNDTDPQPQPGLSCIEYGGCPAASMCQMHDITKFNSTESIVDLSTSSPEEILLLHIQADYVKSKCENALKNRLELFQEISIGSTYAFVEPRWIKDVDPSTVDNLSRLLSECGIPMSECMTIDIRKFNRIKKKILNLDYNNKYIETIKQIENKLNQRKMSGTALRVKTSSGSIIKQQED